MMWYAEITQAAGRWPIEPTPRVVKTQQQRRDVATFGPQKKNSKSYSTSRCSSDSYFIIIKSTGDLIFGIIEGRTDEEQRTKQQ